MGAAWRAVERRSAPGRPVRVPSSKGAGGKDEAIVTAIQMNDLSSKLPLTRTERNEDVKYLLKADWTQELIAKAAGVHSTRFKNIRKPLAARGEMKEKTKPTRDNGGRPEKGVAVLPKDVASKLGDTMLVRIATLRAPAVAGT